MICSASLVFIFCSFFFAFPFVWGAFLFWCLGYLLPSPPFVYLLQTTRVQQALKLPNFWLISNMGMLRKARYHSNHRRRLLEMRRQHLVLPLSLPALLSVGAPKKLGHYHRAVCHAIYSLICCRDSSSAVQALWGLGWLLVCFPTPLSVFLPPEITDFFSFLFFPLFCLTQLKQILLGQSP